MATLKTQGWYLPMAVDPSDLQKVGELEAACDDNGTLRLDTKQSDTAYGDLVGK